MQVKTVIEHFGTAEEAARQLQLAGGSALTNWRRRNRGKVPERYARRLAAMTAGKLKFDPKAYGLDS